jgi:hypothetical protein
MRRFENVDIIDALAGVMERNTKHYQSDFEYDKEMFIAAAESAEPGDKNMLWLSRESGTHCVSERSAFIAGSEAHTTWTYYQGAPNIAAFAVEITGTADGKPVGTLYELDYSRHAEHVKRAALPLTDVTLTFADGNERRFPYEKIKGNWSSTQNQYGRITACVYEVADESALQSLLKQESAERRKYPVRSIAAYLQKLGAPGKPSAVGRLKEAQKAVAPPSPVKAAAKLGPEL